MLQAIIELLEFHRQRFHINIELVRESFEIDSWDEQGILVGMPREVGSIIQVGDFIFQQDGSFSQKTGNLILLGEHPIGVQGENFLLFNVCPMNEPAEHFLRTTIDRVVSKMASDLRKKARSEFLEGVLETAKVRKAELVDSIRNAGYELDDLTEQINRLSRKVALEKKVLKLFDRPETAFKRDVLPWFTQLMKLVPNLYASFRFENGKVIGKTHSIIITYEGCTYDFEPYEVIYSLCDQSVQITGAENENNGYVHPHITYGNGSGSICWGNIHGLVLRLAGEMDVFGLFQLVHQFLSTYNENDPYQRIERWDPNYVEDDEDEPYCRWCDESGHTVDECEWCWWCEYCEDYCDHYEEDCPHRSNNENDPEEETKDDELVSEAA